MDKILFYNKGIMFLFEMSAIVSFPFFILLSESNF